MFLSTELQALQILQKKKNKNSQLDKNSEICQEVQAVCDALGVPKSDTSDIPLLLSQVESKVFYIYKIHVYINILFMIRLNANMSVLYSNCDIDYQFLEKLIFVVEPWPTIWKVLDAFLPQHQNKDTSPKVLCVNLSF